MRILVVEDELDLREAIAARLRALGHGVDAVSLGADADEQLFVQDFDVAILDRMLPDGDTVERVEEWRRRGCTVPIIFLTARDQVEDRIEGFESGADDYLVKPFAMEELVARVGALARRNAQPGPSTIEVADLEVDLGRREVRRAGVLIALRPKEYSLLELLVSRRGRVVSRAEVYDACWDEAREPSSNVEEVLVSSLRRKLGKPSLIRTVREAGYIFEADA